MCSFKFRRYFLTISFRKSWLSRLLEILFVLRRFLCRVYPLIGILSEAASTDGKWVIDLNLFAKNCEVRKV